ncbi:MAG: glycosyltransferase [Anaerovoracaceae bacterium]
MSNELENMKTEDNLSEENQEASEHDNNLEQATMELLDELLAEDEKAAREAAEEEERQKIAREQAEREEAERIAKEEAERLAAEKAARAQTLAAKFGWVDDEDEEEEPEEPPKLSKEEKKALKKAKKASERAVREEEKERAKKQKKQSKKEKKEAKRKKRAAKSKARKDKRRARKAARKARGVERQPKSNASVNILLTTYNPTKQWLKAQLKSINDQNYEHITLTVVDDCSEVVSLEDLQKIVQETITKFPYTVQRNESHMGRERTFEKMTANGAGDYFAYCTQKDIWEPGKIKRCLVEIEDMEADLAFSDASAVNGDGDMIAKSITRIRKDLKYKTGAGLAHHILANNFVMGCTMLVNAEKAKAAVPFCPYMKYDQYLAFSCAKEGTLALVGRPLVKKRIGAQLRGMEPALAYNRESYIEKYIDKPLKALKWIEKEESITEELREKLEQCILWFLMRREIFNKRPKMLRAVWYSREFGIKKPLVELFISKFSEPVASKLLVMYEHMNNRFPEPKKKKGKKKKKTKG